MSARRAASRAPRWAKFLVIIGALIMIFSGGAILGLRALFTHAGNLIPQQSMLGGDSAMAGDSIRGAFNVLLVGIDAEPSYVGPGDREGMLADTIIILHVPATHDQAYLMSIPRDTLVEIPSSRSLGFYGSTEKINAAFGYGYAKPGSEEERRASGVGMVAKTITSLTGLRFQAAALVDFDGFRSVIGELGGVRMCVDHRAESLHLAQNAAGHIVEGWYDEMLGRLRGVPEDYRPVVHEPGCRQMTAQLALDYVRIRKSLPNGDYDRQRHQQQLIKAVVKEATSPDMLANLDKLNRVVAAAGRSLLLDTQGLAVEDFLFTMKDIGAADLTLIKTNAGQYVSESIDGISYQHLTEDSLQMLAAARDGNLVDFLTAHPDFIATE